MNLTKYEPVLAALVLADVPLIVAFVNELATAHPSTITTLLVGVAIVALNAAAAWARSRVTPVVRVKERERTSWGANTTSPPVNTTSPPVRAPIMGHQGSA